MQREKWSSNLIATNWKKKVEHEIFMCSSLKLEYECVEE